MARTVCALTAEVDLIHDAIADIERITRALVKCHGQPYRELERRIERLMDCEIAWGEPKMHWIGDATFIIEPWPEVKAIIREARELEVI